MEIITLGLAALLLFMGGKKKTAKSLEFIPIRLRIKKVNRKKKLVLDVDILNPTKNPLTVNSVFLSLFANNKRIGRIEKGDSFKIGQQRRTTVAFPVSISFPALGQMIADYLLKKPITFKMVGVVNVMGIDQPVDKKIDFSL